MCCSVLERVRLSRERRQGQLNPQLEEQQKKDGLVRQCEAEASLAASAEATAATTITARSPASQAPEAGVAAEATIRCLHALGRCQLFSEKLLQVVSTDHIAAADADSLALYLFECGRMGLRCRRWIGTLLLWLLLWLLNLPRTFIITAVAAELLLCRASMRPLAFGV